MPRLFTPTLLALCLAVPSASAPPRPSHCSTVTGCARRPPLKFKRCWTGAPPPPDS